MKLELRKIENSIGGWISSKYKTLEFWFTWWNPFNSISFKRGIDIHFKGSHSPAIYINIKLICLGIDIEWYDKRH